MRREARVGISDSKWFTMRCVSCTVDETISSDDYGSQWGRQNWRALTVALNFTVASTGGGNAEPEIVSACCNRCQRVADITSGYGRKPL